ncbi:MAG: hypothetical protein KAI55_02210 [Candidatus Aenigmarchaeota archaeon]|nr:hypothetical protein [Candidatus Aenigmarchaeota archaeon]
MAKRKVRFPDVIQVVKNTGHGAGGNATGGGGFNPRVHKPMEETEEQKLQARKNTEEKENILSNSKDYATRKLVEKYSFLSEKEMGDMNTAIKKAGSVGEVNQIEKQLEEEKIKFTNLGSKMTKIRKDMQIKDKELHANYRDAIEKRMTDVDSEIYKSPFPIGFLINQRYPQEHHEEIAALTHPIHPNFVGPRTPMTINDVLKFEGDAGVESDYQYKFFFDIYEENGAKEGRWIKARIIRQKARENIYDKDKINLEVIDENGDLEVQNSGIRNKREIITPAEIREYGYVFLDKLTKNEERFRLRKSETTLKDFTDSHGTTTNLSIKDALTSTDKRIRTEAEREYMQMADESHQELLDIRGTTNDMQDIRKNEYKTHNKEFNEKVKTHHGPNNLLDIKKDLTDGKLTNMDDLKIHENEIKKHSKAHNKAKLIGKIVAEGNWFIVTYESLFEELAGRDHKFTEKAIMGEGGAASSAVRGSRKVGHWAKRNIPIVGGSINQGRVSGTGRRQILRKDEEVRSCPLCGGDVEDIGRGIYRCNQCNVRFNRSQLVIDQKTQEQE